MVGPEIEDRPDVLHKIEELILDPCLLLPDSQVLSKRLEFNTRSVGDIRAKAASDYFECHKNVGERTERVIEIQTVTKTIEVPRSPSLKVRTYRVPTMTFPNR